MRAGTMCRGGDRPGRRAGRRRRNLHLCVLSDNPRTLGPGQSLKPSPPWGEGWVRGKTSPNRNLFRSSDRTPLHPEPSALPSPQGGLRHSHISAIQLFPVIPAKAGIHLSNNLADEVDTGFRRCDDRKINDFNAAEMCESGRGRGRVRLRESVE